MSKTEVKLGSAATEAEISSATTSSFSAFSAALGVSVICSLASDFFSAIKGSSIGGSEGAW